tara:strand:+ start:911 stop:2059 length:1149 start_codon:yes stop_codon:yes gene_type:complete
MRERIIFKFFREKYIFLIFFIFCFPLTYQNNFFNSALKANELESKPNNQEIEVLSSNYIVDSGDSLYLNFTGTPIFSGLYTINPDGDIILPELNRYKVSNLTIEEIEYNLNKSYEKFIYNPDIKVSVISYRPINVYINGGIKRPGLYTFNVGSMGINKINMDELSNLNVNDNQIPDQASKIFIPRIFNVIKAAKGFNYNANLSNVKIIRNNSLRQGGGKIFTEVNLLSLFLEGDQKQNIRLYDGDSIFINEGISINKQILDLNRSNISPEFITVYVSGNVFKSGSIVLKQGSSLLQALASAGGKKNLSGNIAFLRFNPDGTIEKNKFKIDYSAQVNSRKNPILNDGDIVNVERSIIGKTTNVLNEISNPIISGYSLYRIFSD